ncbi:MAG: hypothetical protein K8R34_16820 [Methanosarcinales archaeon]|nr:hypothetical protein [Methanosarcinales archaeon]MCD4810247.1 hypothetical protein [Methanosarcinales archaeon]
MFLESSRYYKLKTVDTVTKDGRTHKAVTLRRLPFITGQSAVVKGNDRLDIISNRQYKDPTMFWHIADASTELQANELVREAGRIITIPEY